MLKDCFAVFDKENTVLTIGNGKIKKTVAFTGSFMRTESVTDTANSKVWSCGSKLWQRCPLLSAEESPKISFTATAVEDVFGMKPHVKAEIELSGEAATVWYEFIVFPSVPFVFTQCFVKAEKSLDTDALAPQSSVVYSGIEANYVSAKDGEVFCNADTLDCIPLGSVHLEVESIKLYDKTDGNDSLVERQTVPIYKNGRCEREGNVFRINDYPSGNAIMLIKHSPTQSSALNRRGCDLFINGSSYAALLGNGIDFSSLPSGKIPYYASAVGVAKNEDIYEELWRYSTSISAADPRKALFIMSNTWGDRSQDIAVCESFMLREIERGKDIGVDIIQIDDGWQLGVTANSRRKKGGVWEGYYKDNPNFWQINPEKFPNGLRPITEKAREYGIEIGLWFSPDSSNDFFNVDKDVATLFDLYKEYGIRYFKLDGVKIRNKLCEVRFIRLLEELTRLSDGDIRFNLDVTAEDRFGYLYQTNYGTLFVENRYTDFVNYFPHNTFKNLWNLASVIPTRRLQMELLNIRRNAEKYSGMPFAPSEYKMDYVFATVIPANPLVWMEMTGLSNEDAELLSKIVGIYKKHTAELYDSRVIPIGNAPNGMTYSGYFCDSDEACHVLLFRETTNDNIHAFTLPRSIDGAKAEVIYSSAPSEFSVKEKEITVNFSEPKSFIWLKISK